MKKEINRSVENKLQQYLDMFGAVLIYGPKFCGKTFLAEKNSNSFYYMQEIGIKNNELINYGRENMILDGTKPRLIDEWQICPSIWDKIRFYVDKSHGEKGLYILTGSSSLNNKKNLLHSGAGRIARLKMSTLTVSEIINDIHRINLLDLFEQKNILFNKYEIGKYDFEWIVKFIIHGGWPNYIDQTKSYANEYIDAIINMNTTHINGLNNKKDKCKMVLRSLARLNASKINKSTILKDLNNEINKETLDKYIEVFDSIYLFDYLNSWSPNIRSKYKTRTSNKLYFCDPSLGLNLLNVNSANDLYNDLNTLGFYFENLVIKDLLVFAQSNDAELFYFGDEKGNEVDVILTLPNGKWAAIEIKLGSDDNIEDALKQLNKLDHLILETKKGFNDKPTFKMIITAHGFPYKRDDGIIVMPHVLLKL